MIKYYYQIKKFKKKNSSVVTGNQFWYRNGLYHREDGPALIGEGGTKYWYEDGMLHRDEGPAIEYTNGYKAWYTYDEYIKEIYD